MNIFSIFLNVIIGVIGVFGGVLTIDLSFDSISSNHSKCQ